MDKFDPIRENIKKIGKLFPELLIEYIDESNEVRQRIDLEKLAILVGEIDIPIDDFEYQFRYVERYLYDWPGKKNAIAEALRPTTSLLVPQQQNSINWDSSENLYIEGDNLEVLKLLQTQYKNTIKMIYIDPPYNTGKSFIYDDNYKDGISDYLKRTNSVHKNHSQSTGRYHANWLNMMYPRLKVARELLSPDGAIFISIEDNELANLKRILDEIFGEDNFVSIVTVENNPKGRKNARFISQSCDYCLIYTKDSTKSYFIENIPKSSSEMRQNEDGKYVHKSGRRVLVGDNDFNKKIDSLNSEKHYSVYFNSEINDLILRKENTIEDTDNQLIESGYKRYTSTRENEFVENTYTRSKFQNLYEEEALDFKEEKIFEKNFSDTTRMKNLLSSKKYKAIIDGQESDFRMDVTTTAAGNTLKEIFKTEKPIFSAPKPVDLIKSFITLFDDKNLTILDFFSGSATTAQAVLEQNLTDGGERKFILIQLPELISEKDEAYKLGYKTISELGRARIEKVIEQLGSHEGFRSFTLSSEV